MRGFDDAQSTQAALTAFGLQAPITEPEHQDIWPENIHAFNVFCRLRTQWNVGLNGLVGLRYETLPFALELEQVPKPDWAEATDGVQTMEIETLRIKREQR